MLRLPDAWVWDFWLAQDGDTYHLFFLRASRALTEPGRRHMRASVGHAVSTDLTGWTQVADAIVPADRPAFDDVAIWTGSVLRGPDQRWHTFYTGAGSAERGLVQRIGHAVSDDLYTWHRDPGGPVLQADPRWYETLGTSSWGDQAWRDPWVFADPEGDGWHMLITARAGDGPVDDRGVIGHARSQDLVTWTARPPLTKPGAGFGQLEVPQVEQIDGRTVLLFSCLRPELAASRRMTGAPGGVWAVTGDGPLGPFDPGAAHPVTDSSLYSGRIVRDPHGRPMLLAFRNIGADGTFVGELSDPMPVALTADGRLTIVADA
ncbi:glycosyl hydrolase family 32 [Dactylosporangium sp. NPDC051541]|uniref:glycosyl hydrolase family 32 n=1 Tax=Dactylosporangium sp. NPDC051541 TaxID=3363977 RepID=UPI0037ACDF88